MLRGIHKASSTWLGKGILAVIIGFLVISFAVWGIGDIFRGYGRNAVAAVGSTEISVEDFRQYYNDRIQRISRQLGRPISSADARALGLDRQILGQMVAETTLDEKAKELGLGVSNEAIAHRIQTDPAFVGADGNFSRLRFEDAIRNAGFTEARFVAEQRNVMLRRQIAQSISGDMRVPDIAIKAIDQFRNEKRDIDYLALGPAQAGTVPAPSEETLKEYYEAHKAQFRAPEYRKITVLSLSPQALADPASVPETEVKSYYERNKAQYGKAEEREVRQILFPNEDEAKAAREKIAAGTSFTDIATARGLKASDTDLGMITRSQIIDPAVAEAAFSLKTGEVSQPVKGNFGTVLVTVGKIEAGEQKSYDEVAADIKKDLAEQKARNRIGELRDRIEDEKASGATLAEVGNKLGLSTRVVEAIDRAGNAPDGKPAPDLPSEPNVASAAFNSDVGVDNEALQLPDGGYLYYDVTGITPSHDRAFDTVKDKVESRWRDDEVAKRLKEKADALLAKLKAGGTLKALADENGLQVQTAKDVQRGKPGFAPARLVQVAFTTPKDVPGETRGQQAGEYYVFKVTAVTEPEFEPKMPAGRAVAEQLQNAYADDIIGAYIGQIQNQMGVSINQTALNQVIGGEPGS